MGGAGPVRCARPLRRSRRVLGARAADCGLDPLPALPFRVPLDHQRCDLVDDCRLAQFRGFGAAVARELDGVHIATPDVVYDDAYDLDLGGRSVQLRPTGRAHTKGDQVVTVPDAGVMFTGDLVETGQFSIFPWFPPYDTDVSGIRWIEVMKRLADADPKVVVPGHGDIGGGQRLADVRDYLELLRDETWVRRDSAMSEATIIDEVTALMIERHPEWEGREWIQPAVSCLCSEHAS